MALRDQPYLPLYVNDFLSDEKLNNCSAESTGIYIRLMCLMHKSEKYGMFVLNERDKIRYKSQANLEHASPNHAQIFAAKLRRFMPYSEEEIQRGIEELVSYGVIQMNEDYLLQPRMVRDGELSSARAKAGSAGGKAVRNSSTRKNYNEPGYLYVAEDSNDETCHKVGITKNLRNRLNGLRRQSQREMVFVFNAAVSDMGTVEDNILTLLNPIRDGEWIYGHPLSTIMDVVNQCVKIKSKSRANPENEIEDEDDIDIEPDREGVEENNDLGDVMSFYMDKINPTPSSQIVEDLKTYTETMDSDVVIHAMQIALDERKYAWSYINAILRRYLQEGLWTMNAVMQQEQEHSAKKRRGGEKKQTFLDMYLEDEK